MGRLTKLVAQYASDMFTPAKSIARGKELRTARLRGRLISRAEEAVKASVNKKSKTDALSAARKAARSPKDVPASLGSSKDAATRVAHLKNKRAAAQAKKLDEYVADGVDTETLERISRARRRTAIGGGVIGGTAGGAAIVNAAEKSWSQ